MFLLAKFAQLFYVKGLLLKGKIINDPVYGFLNFRHQLLLDILEHPFFQRLRRIRQMGMAHFVYPGAVHTRFHHSLGAAHLMQQALQVLDSKGHKLPDHTYIAAQAAILLHDLGHGPFSHALEQCIIPNMHHEELSLLMMQRINADLGGQLAEAIEIFTGRHPVPYLQQLVSGQLDMDRMDYLNRDSFYTGVSEGVIGYDRILQMIEVDSRGRLVVESKGIHSVEKFLVARRLMYWQVYLHKAVLATEQLLIQIMKRAKKLAHDGVELFATPAFQYFLYQDQGEDKFESSGGALEVFAELDDSDISASIKVWRKHEDPILSRLCTMLIDRRLFKVKLLSENLESQYQRIYESALSATQYSEEELSYYIVFGSTGNKTYNTDDEIMISFKDGSIKPITQIDDALIQGNLTQPVVKNYIAVIPEFTPYLHEQFQ